MTRLFSPRALPVAVAVAAALGSTSALADTHIKAVASFSILGDVVRAVGGDAVEVTDLIPANGDPHEFEPSPADSRLLKEADVTFLSGEGLENWFERLAKASGSTKAPVVVSEGISTHTMDEDGETVIDPHVWNAVPNVEHWVGAIETALIKADPEDAATFKANADAYRTKLQKLDGWIRDELANIPKDQRKVLTSHDAFGYYAKAYGVTFLSPLGLSTDADASAAEVASLIKQIQAEGVKTYFFENSNDPRLVKQIASATGAQSGGELYPESLSGEDGPASTYLKLMHYNTEMLVKAMKK
ncbi:metal ABC transporter solute-binding protein, Zn/Mn family [Pokkaliibacter sp. CJK22405]|uniref:metal ABC transporter solute-binding protein, Zn/Mn family n=1 Tax=Pokkaliibacter sp. CJK22405 TaxID=3384615 RepID=UPI0039851454